MKSVVKMLCMATVVALTLGACSKDNPNYIKGGEDDKDNIGYLAVGGLKADVMLDTENFASETSKTRAGEVDINTFSVVITNTEGAVVGEFLYGERPAEPIELPGGVYKLTMSSGDMAGAEWESPVYRAEKEFVVVRKQTTVVDDIVCKLANIKVTVAYSADIADQLDPDYTTMNVALEDSSLLYAMTESRAGYFEPVDVENTLVFTLNCRYVGQDKDIVMTHSISGVKAAQWRKVNVVIAHASDGTASIGIKCDTWAYDEEVVFDTATFLMEETIADDTDLPIISWEGYDLAEEFELTDDMFDADGNFTKSINIDITATSAISSIKVKVESDNAEFENAYSEIMPLEEDLCAPTASAAILKMMGYPTDAAGQTSTRLKFASQAELLRTYEGTHTYLITVTDSEGRTSTATLTIVYGNSQAASPSIVWVGYNIDERQTYVAGMTCDLAVTAANGIADFLVKIISDTLTPEELAGVGLAAEFSLVNDTQYFDQLGGLGFPVGDAVVDKKELELSITNFLGLLSALGGGDHDFEMTVIDTKGNTTTKTVMMHFE